MAAADYFEVLEVTRDSGADEVKRAFRRMATRFHPDTHPENATFCARKFAEVCAAYEVLSDAKLRAVYTQYGAEALRAGVSEKLGLRPFVPSPPESVFAKFFGTPNPHAVGLAPSLEELKATAPIDGVPPTLGTLRVTLEDVFAGATKLFTFSRRSTTGGGEEKQQCSMSVQLPRGIADRSQLTFRGEGDGGGDLLIVVEQQRHPRFERRGPADLVHRVQVSLAQALLGTVVQVSTLDGRELRVAVNEVVSEGFEKVVPGEGMPGGDLHIVFHVVFPTTLSDRQRQLIRAALVEPEPKHPAK